MHKSIICIISSLMLFGCSSEFQPIEISKYEISTDLIENKEPVKIIYSPGYPNYKDTDFYVNCIVVTTANDTFNVLVDPVYDANENRNKIFVKEGSTEFNLGKNTSQKIDIFDLQSIHIERAPFVIVNKNHPAAENNNFPTVVGLLVSEVKYIK